MKKNGQRRLILMATLVTAISLLLVSCPMDEDDGVSIQERINMFMNDVNAERYDRLWRHTHPDAEQYDQAKDENTWTAMFPADATSTYILASNEPVGSTVTTTINGGVYEGDPIEFQMQEDGSDNWKIRRLIVNDDEQLTFKSLGGKRVFD